MLVVSTIREIDTLAKFDKKGLMKIISGMKPWLVYLSNFNL